MRDEPRRCGALTRRGAPCRRRVAAGASRCHLHAGPFADLFSAEEQAALAGLQGPRRVEEVLPVLLVAIRRALAGGAAPAVVVRACEAYARALRQLPAAPADEVNEAAFLDALRALSRLASEEPGETPARYGPATGA